MDEQKFQVKLQSLLDKIETLPQEHRKSLEQLAAHTADRRRRLHGAVSELQDSMDYLRLSVKYLVFDLEATRRENGYLRKLLEQSSREDAPRPDRDEDMYGGDEY